MTLVGLPSCKPKPKWALIFLSVSLCALALVRFAAAGWLAGCDRVSRSEFCKSSWSRVNLFSPFWKRVRSRRPKWAGLAHPPVRFFGLGAGGVWGVWCCFQMFVGFWHARLPLRSRHFRLQKRLAPRSRILSLQKKEEELREQAAAMWSTTVAPFSLTFVQRKKHPNCDVIISCASSSSSSSSSCACSIIIVIIIIIIIMFLQISAEFED